MKEVVIKEDDLEENDSNDEYFEVIKTRNKKIESDNKYEGRVR